MKHLILSGCAGRMGRMLESLIEQRDDCCIAAGVDLAPYHSGEFPVYSDWERCPPNADGILDFSSPAGLSPMLEFATGHRIPVVLGTTGLSSSQVEEVTSASKTIPVFWSANFSLPVALMAHLVEETARSLGADFDVELLELHHRGKADAPSGTAEVLMNAVNTGLGASLSPVYGRKGDSQRQSEEIGIHSLRGGSFAGEHAVLFCGQGEMLSIQHTALSREIFAHGAIRAMLYLQGCSAGLYGMEKLLQF